MKFIPINTMLSLDFNYNTAIFRGLMLRNLESVRILVSYLLSYKMSNVYKDALMLDLKYLIQEKNINILDYFGESIHEKRAVDRDL